MRLRLSPLVAALILTALGAPARAAKEFARVERVDVEPYFDELAKVRVYLTLEHLQGSLIDKVKPTDLLLTVGKEKSDAVPWIGDYDNLDEELEIVVVVEVGTPYAGVIDTLNAAGLAFLKDLPKTARVAVIPYGSKVGRAAKLGDLAAAQRAWKKLRAEDEEGPLNLVDAVDRAVKLLAGTQPGKPRNGVRRLLIVISDGIQGTAEDEDDDEARGAIRKKVKKVAKAAADAGITIHTVAFSFFDNRKPLLNLGELSKRTGGTFRWAKLQEGIEPHLNNLKLEIRHQLVLTYFLPEEQVEGDKTLTVSCKSAACGDELPLVSNARKAGAMACGGEICDGACALGECAALSASGGHRWWLWLLGIAGVAALVAGVVKLRKRGEQPRPMPGMVPGMKPGMPMAAGAQHVQPPRMSVGMPVPQQQHMQQHMQQRPPVQAAGSAPAPQAQGAGWFLILSGPRAGQHVPLRHGFNIGKAPGNDLLIDDGFTSGRHAQVVIDQQGFALVDVGSTNGTFVNGVRASHARLQHGTSVRIGQTELRFLKG